MKLVFLAKINVINSSIDKYLFYDVADIQLSKSSEENVYRLSIENPKFEHQNIDDFLYEGYPEVKNLSLIVGENGSGKTTLLKNLKYFLNSANSKEVESSDFVMIGVFYIEQSHTFQYYKTSEKIQITLNNNIDIMNENNLANYMKENQIFYLSDDLNKNDFLDDVDESKIDDQSFGARLRKRSDEYRIIDYYNHEVQVQLRFLQSNFYKENKDEFPIKFPSSIRVSFSTDQFHRQTMDFFDDFETLEEGISLMGDSIKKITGHLKNIPSLPKQSFSSMFYRYSLIEIFSDIFQTLRSQFVRRQWSNISQKDKTTSSIDHSSEFQSTINNIINKIDPIISKKHILSGEYSHGLDRIEEIVHEYLGRENLYIENLDKESRDNLITHVELLEKSFKVISKNETQFISHFDKVDIKSNKKRNKQTIEGTTIKIFIDFFEHYSKHSYSFLNFDWRMSTGENNFFNLYALLYDSFERSGKSLRSDNHWILIDEAASSFHPDWQIKFIKSLIITLSKLLQKKNIHIFLTTHSPILISEVPNHSVLRLTKKPQSENTTIKVKTFGQNIYTLFSDVFITDDDKNKSFSTDGNFSTDVFNRMNEKLDELEKKHSDENIQRQEIIENLLSVASVIGEDMKRMFYINRIQNLNSYINVEESKKIYDLMSVSQKKDLIKHILKDSLK